MRRLCLAVVVACVAAGKRGGGRHKPQAEELPPAPVELPPAPVDSAEMVALPSFEEQHALNAALRRSQLLLMDEATANIDYATDAVIQRVVREQFRSSTILTIAHRLDTIIDYDTVLLMADGRVAESGRPADLLASDQSKFHALVARGGDAVVTRLKAAAATSPTRAST